MAPDEIDEFRRIAALADANRHAGQWQLALDGYQHALVYLPKLASLHHNVALCQLALANFVAAAASSQQALELNPDLWQSRVVRLKALRKLGDSSQAIAEIEQHPTGVHGPIEIERASLAMNALGDADQAIRYVLPFIDNETVREDANRIAVLAALYEPRANSPAIVNQALCDFACEYILPAGEQYRQWPSSIKGNRRQRVGVISPQFTASPVYFCGIGALRCLQGDFDLVFFDRGSREDWATREFHCIASDWINVAQLDATALEAELTRHELDVLIDMGGWMDVTALRALAQKPARTMFKWVGGQSATTGLRSFDGFLSDKHQSPITMQSLYVEPLVLLDAGYVSYTPPPYLPVPRMADPGLILGIIANPVKLSQHWFAEIKARLGVWKQDGIEPTLRFIEARYQHDRLRQRIVAALGDSVKLEFIAPSGHLGYLEEVARLTAVIDSFPYTGGLTTLESLALGVPCFTRWGSLFSQRHSAAHCCFAGLRESEFLLESYHPQPASAGRTRLLTESSPRMNHAALADNLADCFRSTP